jgi:hypothetical protein
MEIRLHGLQPWRGEGACVSLCFRSREAKLTTVQLKLQNNILLMEIHFIWNLRRELTLRLRGITIFHS